jgi:hypothetical protein
VTQAALIMEEGSAGVEDSWENRDLNLWSAVLHRAIADLVLYRSAIDIQKQRLFQEAHGWINDEVDEFPSFTFLCSILGLRPAAVRGATNVLTRDDLKDLRKHLGLGR